VRNDQQQDHSTLLLN